MKVESHSSKLPLWPWLAVLASLLMLAALVMRGIDAQSKAAWTEFEEQSARAAQAAAAHLADKFAQLERRYPVYPDPPLPGEPSSLDAVLEGSDTAALNEIVDSTDKSLTPSGLPRRAVAALRLMALDPLQSEDRSGRLLRIFVSDCPSVLTESGLRKLKQPNESSLRDWKDAEEGRKILRNWPQGGWIDDKGTYSWVKIEEDRVCYVRGRSVAMELKEKTLHYMAPKGFKIKVSKSTTEPRSNEAPDLFGAAPISFGEGLRAEVVVRDRAVIDEALHRDRSWTLLLLALAAAGVAGGLLLLVLTLRRERQLNDMKSQFVASVSHELRAPVASIRLMADALEAGKVAPETAREFHRLIAREGARLSTLVGNVLDHSRIERGLRQWKLEPSDLESLVADTVLLMEPLAKEKGVRLETRLVPVEAKVDAGAIQQALVNLLDNAIKFSPAGGRIEVSLSEEGMNLHLRVKDEGPGIPKHEHKRIFERFYRPGDELRRETQGTGIGLSLVKSIAEAHDGAVNLESETGEGSTFTLHLPR